MSTTQPSPSFRLRSFVQRNGRKTAGQKRALAELGPSFVLATAQGYINDKDVFGRLAPCFLEIGFGSGQSLLALANTRPEHDFIGVETHQPGIGALLLGIEELKLTNIRVYQADVIDVLENNLPDQYLDGAQIFFPDPWPKRAHHPRRLIQPAFIKLLISKLKSGASLHLATDWEDYAKHMQQVLSAEPLLINIAGSNQFAERSDRRPVLTKFERRAIKEGRAIWELQFKKL